MHLVDVGVGDGEDRVEVVDVVATDDVTVVGVVDAGHDCLLSVRPGTRPEYDVEERASSGGIGEVDGRVRA